MAPTGRLRAVNNALQVREADERVREASDLEVGQGGTIIVVGRRTGIHHRKTNTAASTVCLLQ